MPASGKSRRGRRHAGSAHFDPRRPLRFATASMPGSKVASRRYIKSQKYTLVSRKENLTLDGKKALKILLAPTNGSTRPMFSR
jgi:hypothetical protein